MKTLKSLKILFIFLIVISCSNSNETQLFKLEKSYPLNLSEPSGLSFDSQNNLLVVVDDAVDSIIYKFDLEGNLAQTLELNFNGGNFEGVSFNPLNEGFFITDELRSKIYSVDSLGNKISEITPEATDLNSSDGLEAITFHSSENYLVTVKEKNPSKIIQLNLDGSLIREINADYGLKDFSGLFLDETENKLYILSDQSKKIVILDFASPFNSYDDFSFAIEKSEGVCLDNEGNLWIVSETERSLSKFSKN